MTGPSPVTASMPATGREALMDRARPLLPAERATPGHSGDGPLVIEAREPRSDRELRGLLAGKGLEILGQVERHGAVLLRGFNVPTAVDFESAMLSVPNLRGMNQVFMSEAGRTVINGASFAMHTNTLYKTGGSFSRVGGFHSENYYNPDVPRYIAFYCERPSLFGGETGVIDMARVFEELPERVRKQLAAQACAVQSSNLAEVAARYQTTEANAVRACLESGMEVVEKDGHSHVCLYKPSLVRLPAIDGMALTANISLELGARGLNEHLHQAFRADYNSTKWGLHRLVWSSSWLSQMAQIIENPRAAWVVIKRSLKNRIFVARNRNQLPPARLGAFGHRIGEAFTQDDLPGLANAMRRNFSAFRWQRGDIFVLDNLRMAHAGMPGFGRRTIRAFICNPVEISPRAGSGMAEPRSLGASRCVGERFEALRVSESQQVGGSHT